MANELGMSDEEFLNSPIPEEVKEVEEAPEELSEESSEEEDESVEEVVEDPEIEEELDSEEDPDDTPEEEEASPVKEDYQKVFEPFKANGEEVQVKTSEEAIQLMQMGANYTKKMQALQPNLKVLKMLEAQDLLSEEKLSFLIDLNKRDPSAIAKLVKDSKIDVMDLDSENGEEYVPKNYSVPDAAIQLDQVLSDIESTPTGSKCIELVGQQWDDSSKQVLAREPQLIKQLNEQMQAGIFDQINSEVKRLSMFGGLSGLSDFDAYRQVGSRLFQEGKLGNAKPEPIAKTKVATKAQDNVRASNRRAASSPKNSSKTGTKKEDFNPLNMSDEEFEKLFNQRR